MVFNFEVALLRLLGHEPQVSACVECGAPRGRIKEIAFSPLKGGCLCEKCAQSDLDAITIRGSAAALIEALGKQQLSSGRKAGVVRAGRLEISRDDAKDLRRVLDRFFTFLRERPSKTLRYMQASYK
jgi:recombinational DNA repair protein (RecF pathway)